MNIVFTGGSRGGALGTPPYGSRFFCFDMQNFWNVAASGVHGPPYEVHAPSYGKSWIRHWFCVMFQNFFETNIFYDYQGIKTSKNLIVQFDKFNGQTSVAISCASSPVISLHWCSLSCGAV